jgi:hypothetical protein
MSLLWSSFDPKLLNIQVAICINFALSKSANNFEENSKNFKNFTNYVEMTISEGQWKI